MQEQSVTVAGKAHRLESPFMVLATQNPIEMEGTYPLPEAQIDRFFFKLLLQYPSREELVRIADLTTSAPPAALNRVLAAETILKIRAWVREVPIADAVKDYAARLILATHPERNGQVASAEKYVLYGASPRGLQTLVLAAKARALVSERPNVSFEDIRAVAPQSLSHRIILNLEGEAEGVTAARVVAEVIGSVAEISS
jgi:MoxR-like ATPase